MDREKKQEVSALPVGELGVLRFVKKESLGLKNRERSSRGYSLATHALGFTCEGNWEKGLEKSHHESHKRVISYLPSLGYGRAKREI